MRRPQIHGHATVPVARRMPSWGGCRREDAREACAAGARDPGGERRKRSVSSQRCSSRFCKDFISLIGNGFSIFSSLCKKSTVTSAIYRVDRVINRDRNYQKYTIFGLSCMIIMGTRPSVTCEVWEEKTRDWASQSVKHVTCGTRCIFFSH